MIFWTELRLFHENLPNPFLKLWGSSKNLVSLSRRLALGRGYDRCYKLLEGMQDWSLDEIYEFQFERFKKILDHAYKNVPYYQEMFNKEKLKPLNIKCLEDLQKIPITTKEDIFKNYNKFFAKNSWYKRKVYRTTSGTSGKSLKVWMDEEHIAAASATTQHFRKFFLGYMMGQEMILQAAFSLGSCFNFFMYKENCFGFYSPVGKFVFFPWRFSVGDKSFESYVKTIRKFNIKHIEGLPSVCFAFAKYLAKKNERVKIKTTLLSGEALYDFQRRFIEKQLHCKVFNLYGQEEQTIFACECHKHKGLHIDPLLGIAEVKDWGLKGKGEIVMTNLWNNSWPIIRYSTKDIVSLSQKKCSCGCAFPRLMNIEGRHNDFIILPNKEYLPAMPFTWLNMIPGVKDIFFTQNEDYSLDILVVKEETADAENIKNIIRQKVNKISRKMLKTNILFVEGIDRKSKKYRIVETKIPFEFNKK